MADLDLKALIADSFDVTGSGTARRLKRLSLEVSFIKILLDFLIHRAPDLLDDPFLKAVYDALSESEEDDAFNEALKRLQPLLEEFNRKHAEYPIR